ncbi:MAG: hypothetical protein AAGA21_00410 [Pseudomonadota bacterium]
MNYRRVFYHISCGLAFLALIGASGCSPELLERQILRAVEQRPAVHFKTEGRALRNAELKSEENILGLVGDFVELKDGTYDVSLDAPNDYELHFSLLVDGNRLSVLESDARPANCSPERRVRWPQPKTARSADYNNVRTITLEDPIFGPPTGEPISCIQHSWLGCSKRKVILTAESEPRGAEIWIDGKKQDNQTNRTLSVPYCVDDKVKSVLLRMENKINCEESVDLSPDARVTIACAFQDPIPTGN